MSWSVWQLPVISYEQLLDENAAATSTSKARILIIKTLGDSTQVNYIGLLIQGLPRLKKVTGDSLIEKQTVNLPETLFSKVSIDDQEALIPEIADLTRVVEQAAYDS